MTFTLNDGEKFACVAFQNIALDDALPSSIDLGDNYWVLRKSPFLIDTTWREWLGSIRSEELDNCNLFLLSKRYAKSPEVLDGENEELKQQLLRLFYGLFLQGIPEEPRAYKLTGALVEGRVAIRQYVPVEAHHRSRCADKFHVGVTRCTEAKKIADGLSVIYSSADYDRLKRGLRAVIRGMRELNGEDRLHEYVRALEALIKPNVGKTKQQFIHRCQTFAVASPAAKNILDECYEIRNTVEHMHHWEKPLAAYPKSGRENIGYQRLRQIESLSLSVYQKITTSTQHLALFMTDSDIDAFWKKTDDQRAQLWGQAIDIATIS